MFNYTGAAHNTLCYHPSGWTGPLRLCRGIIFDFSANLVALPFPKFFNYGDSLETRILSDLPFEATVKHDGHLGIIFRYDGNFHITTRGYFDSRTSLLADPMLQRCAAEHDWDQNYPTDTTALVEIIHPETEVLTDYAGFEGFYLIGAYNNRSADDLDYSGLSALSQKLGLPATQIWLGNSLAELLVLIGDRTVANREGYVVRFSNGLRLKFKFETYVGKMIAKKLSHAYLMRRVAAGDLKTKMLLLPEEIYDNALRMLGEITLAMSVTGSQQTKWRELYTILPEDQRTPYNKGVCREFVKALCNTI
jgi:RNA ligase